jgi:hypothetical protein
VLCQDQHRKKEQLVDDEEQSAHPSEDHEAGLHKRHPQEVLNLIPANRTQRNPEESDLGAHPAERAPRESNAAVLL